MPFFHYPSGWRFKGPTARLKIPTVPHLSPTRRATPDAVSLPRRYLVPAFSQRSLTSPDRGHHNKRTSGRFFLSTLGSARSRWVSSLVLLIADGLCRFFRVAPGSFDGAVIWSIGELAEVAGRVRTCCGFRTDRGREDYWNSAAHFFSGGSCEGSKGAVYSNSGRWN